MSLKKNLEVFTESFRGGGGGGGGGIRGPPPGLSSRTMKPTRASSSSERKTNVIETIIQTSDKAATLKIIRLFVVHSFFALSSYKLRYSSFSLF